MKSFLALAAVCLAVPSPADAQRVSLTVTPAVFELKVAPGDGGSQIVTFVNNGIHSLVVRPEVMDWAPDKNGAYLPVAAGVLADSVVPWFTIHPASVLIPQGQSGTFTVTVSVPKGANGGHYAMVYMVARDNVQGGPQSGMAFGADIGVKVLIDTGRTTPKLETRIIKVSPPSSAEKLKATIELKNVGDVHIIAEPSLELLGPMDDFVGTVLPERQHELLLPGQTKTLELEWGGSLSPAKYQALATVYYGKQQSAFDEADLLVRDAPALVARPAASGRRPVPPRPPSVMASSAPSPSHPAATMAPDASKRKAIGNKGTKRHKKKVRKKPL